MGGAIVIVYPPWGGLETEAMEDTTKRDALRRLAYIEGHLRGVRRMVEADTYCVDVLHQTHAIQKALEGFEQLLLQGHLRTCVPSGIRAGREEAVLAELAELYGVARRWRGAEAADDASAAPDAATAASVNTSGAPGDEAAASEAGDAAGGAPGAGGDAASAPGAAHAAAAGPSSMNRRGASRLAATPAAHPIGETHGRRAAR